MSHSSSPLLLSPVLSLSFPCLPDPEGGCLYSCILWNVSDFPVFAPTPLGLLFVFFETGFLCSSDCSGTQREPPASASQAVGGKASCGLMT